MQVIGDLPVIAGERGHESLPVGLIPKRQRGQPQPGRPALGPLPQQRHLGRLEVEREGVVQQRPGLRVAEAKLRGADLQDLARGAQAAQRERRIRPCRDRQLHVRGKMAEQKGDRGVDRLLPHPVIVIQHQHQAAPGRCQLVEQRRQDRAGQVAGSIGQRSQRRLADLRHHGAHRPDHIAPEAHPVIVAGIQRHPGKHARLRGVPLAQDARLPPPRRRADEHQLAVAGAHQPADQLTARHHARPQRRYVQLRRHQHRPLRRARRRGRAHHACPTARW